MWQGAGQRLKMRLALYRSQNGLCYYCDSFMVLTQRQVNTITIDHKVPRSKGGDNSTANRVGACWQCNTAKGDMPEAEFKEQLRSGHVLNIQPGSNGDAVRKLRYRIAKQVAKSVAKAENMPRGERHKLREKFSQIARNADPKELAQYPELRDALAGWYFRPVKEQDDGI